MSPDATVGGADDGTIALVVGGGVGVGTVEVLTDATVVDTVVSGAVLDAGVAVATLVAVTAGSLVATVVEGKAAVELLVATVGAAVVD